MLNRKVSNYLFYFVLVAIVVVIVLVRIVTIGNLDDRISGLKLNNISLEAQITAIEEIVEDNNDIQLDHLFELYSEVPKHYSESELTKYTTAQLELVGITEEPDMQRDVLPNLGVTFGEGTIFGELQNEFKVVEVKVFFSTQDDTVIQAFIDLLYDADQVFVIHKIQFSSPDGENFIGVSIDFLAFYEKTDES